MQSKVWGLISQSMKCRSKQVISVYAFRVSKNNFCIQAYFHHKHTDLFLFSVLQSVSKVCHISSYDGVYVATENLHGFRILEGKQWLCMLIDDEVFRI